MIGLLLILAQVEAERARPAKCDITVEATLDPSGDTFRAELEGPDCAHDAAPEWSSHLRPYEIRPGDAFMAYAQRPGWEHGYVLVQACIRLRHLSRGGDPQMLCSWPLTEVRW